MSKLIVIFIFARLRRKGKPSTGGGGGRGVRILNTTAHLCLTLWSYPILYLFNQAHDDVFFCVFTMFSIEKRGLFPPQLIIITLIFIIIIQH